MKEPILEYLQTAEPETKIFNIEKSDNDLGVDMKKLSFDRKRTMHEWNSKVKDSSMHKVEKRTQ
jgi:hypothetical protein